MHCVYILFCVSIFSHNQSNPKKSQTTHCFAILVKIDLQNNLNIIW